MAATSNRPIANAPYRVYWHSYNVTTGALNTGDAANMDAEIRQNGGSFIDVADSEHETANGEYYSDLTAAEMGGTDICVIVKTSTANMFRPRVEIKTEPALDSGVMQAGSVSLTAVLRAGASSLNDFYNGALIEVVDGTGAGQVRHISDYTGSSRTAIIDFAWITTPDNTSVYIVKPDLGASMLAVGSNMVAQADVRTAGGDITNYANIALGLKSWALLSFGGNVDDAAPTTTSFDSSLTGIDNFWKYASLTFTSGTLRGITRQITGFTTAGIVSLFPALPNAPANGDFFVVDGLFI